METGGVYVLIERDSLLCSNVSTVLPKLTLGHLPWGRGNNEDGEASASAT